MERISLHSAQGQRPLPHNSHLKLKHLSQAQLRDRGGGAAARIGSVPIHTPISSTLLLISHADAFSGQLGSSGWGRELQKHSLSSLLFCLIFPHPTLGAQMGASTGDNLGKGIKKGIGNPIKSLKSPPALLSRAKSPPSFRRLVPPLFALWSPPPPTFRSLVPPPPPTFLRLVPPPKKSFRRLVPPFSLSGPPPPPHFSSSGPPP